ncbi:MAG: NAD(P)/FAD-dependent oxidoreductase [Clostridia bacterium]|nr:NAD(P)/FAD-dependent oxidoreductase [Clostridia bacterium]
MRHIIIGVGAAGITAAKTIRAYDKEAQIIMISEDSYVHSRCMLHRYISGERDEAGLNFAGEDFFEKENIMWVNEAAVKKILDETHEIVIIKDGQEMKFSYDRLLIATGANSVIPPVGDFREAKNVFGLRHLSDAQKICKAIKKDSKVLVVGSGLVGLDAAYALLERKLDVTVVEMAERILPIQLDDTGAKAYQDLFEKAGCHFYLGKKASKTIMNADHMIDTVVLDDGTELACDVIIVAAGVRPAIGCVEESRIKAERFIEVNERMETSVKDIYAAGDVAGRSGIWPNAQKQGQIAGYNMCGVQMAYIDTYAMKNTINFYGLATLSLGRGEALETDEVVICEDRHNYKKAIIRDGVLDSITLQGDIDYSGIYQYLIKNKIKLPQNGKDIFHLNFGDFYGIQDDGQYSYENVTE